jgi:hypothetical protein
MVHMEQSAMRENGLTTRGYDAFGDTGTTFRLLAWKAAIFSERAAPRNPAAP